MLTIVVNGTPLIRFLYIVPCEHDYMNIAMYAKGYVMICQNRKASKVCSTILSIVLMRLQISSSSLGPQRNILVKIWNEICRNGERRWI